MSKPATVLRLVKPTSEIVNRQREIRAENRLAREQEREREKVLREQESERRKAFAIAEARRIMENGNLPELKTNLGRLLLGNDAVRKMIGDSKVREVLKQSLPDNVA